MGGGSADGQTVKADQPCLVGGEAKRQAQEIREAGFASRVKRLASRKLNATDNVGTEGVIADAGSSPCARAP